MRHGIITSAMGRRDAGRRTAVRGSRTGRTECRPGIRAVRGRPRRGDRYIAWLALREGRKRGPAKMNTIRSQRSDPSFR